MPKYGLAKYGAVKYGSEYKTAIAANARTTRITGTLTLADTTDIAITLSMVISGSLYLSEQCVTGENIEIGNVFASELGVELLTSENLEGAHLHLLFGILTGYTEDEIPVEIWEDIPLGVFNVVDPKRNVLSTNIVALDNMILLDVTLGATNVTAQTPEQLITNACTTASVTLATTHATFETYPNKALSLALPVNSAVKTCRDLIMWTCQVNSTFARMSRAGALEIVPLHSASVRSITSTERYSPTVVSDLAIKITGLDMKIGETLYSVGTTDSIMALQGNPLFESLDAATIDSALDAILADITQAEYTPFDISFIGDPTLRAGDYITLNDTSSLGGDPVGLITHNTWHYRGKHSLRSAGKSGLVPTSVDQNKKKLTSLTADVAHIVDLIVTGKLTVGSGTTYESGYDPLTKRTVFTAQPTTPYRVGDLWLTSLTDSMGDFKKCIVQLLTGPYNAAHWVTATKYTDDTVAISKSKVFAQDAIPTSISAGDLWFDTNDGNKCYKSTAIGDNEISAGEWVLYQDLNKTTTFAQVGMPTSITIGDIWIDTDDNNKMYRSTSIGAAVAAVPIMTADNAPAPYVASTSFVQLVNSVVAAYMAFDGNSGTYSHATNGVTTGAFNMDFGTAKTITMYSMMGQAGYLTRFPKTWTFQGSNNDADWTTLDTITDYPIGNWAVYSYSNFICANTTAYRYYRINVSANHGGPVLTLSGIQFYTGGWSLVRDSGINIAIQAAANAQSIADSKRTVFMAEPTIPYYVGDLWITSVTDNIGDLRKCVVQRLTGAYTAADWVVALSMIEVAKLGTTIIEGGFIKTGLVSASNINTGSLTVGGTSGYVGSISVLNALGSEIATIDVNGINVVGLVGATGFTGNNGTAAVTMEFLATYAQMKLSDLYEDFYEPILFRTTHIRASYDTQGTTYWSTDASSLFIGDLIAGSTLESVKILNVLTLTPTEVFFDISAVEVIHLTSTSVEVLGVPVVTSWAMADWSPTLGGITIGNGTVVARSKQLGVLSYFEFNLTFGSTTSVTGAMTFTLPSTAKTAHMVYGAIFGGGATWYLLMGMLNASSATCTLRVTNAAGTYLTVGTAISSTVPITWATGDILRISGWYEH